MIRRGREIHSTRQLAAAVRSLGDDTRAIKAHLLRAEPPWYRRLSMRDITLVITVVAFLFTAFQFRDTFTKFEQRKRLVQAIANAALSLSQDLAFRSHGAAVKKQVIDELLAHAHNLAPQDPDVVSVRIYSEFMFRATAPSENDLSWMDAQIRFFDRLKRLEGNRSVLSKLFEIKNSEIVTPGRFLQKLHYVGADAHIRYLERAGDKADSILFDRAQRYLRNGIAISRDEGDVVYEAVLWAKMADLALLGMARDASHFELEFNDAMDKADSLFTRLRDDRKPEHQLTGYDGLAEAAYQRGKFLHLTRREDEAVAALQLSLKHYREVAKRFPGHANDDGVKKVAAYLDAIRRSRPKIAR
jgi:hypothetical protein